MPVPGSMSRRLEMLMEVGVSGLHNVDTLTQKVKAAALTTEEFATELTKTEGASKAVIKNYSALEKAITAVEKAGANYDKANRRILETEERLLQISQAQVHVRNESASTIKAQADATQNLNSTLQTLTEKSKIAFTPIEEGSKAGRTTLVQLTKALDQYKSELAAIESKPLVPQRNEAGKFTGKKGLSPKDAAAAGTLRQDISGLELAIAGLEDYNVKLEVSKSRVKDLRDEERKLSDAHTSAAKSLAVANDKLKDAEYRLESVAEDMKRLTGDTMGMTKVDDKYRVNLEQLAEAKREVQDITRKVSQAYDNEKAATKAVAAEAKRLRDEKKRLADAAAEDAKQWDSLRQRISRTEAGLFGFRRSLGALRNQILVLVFATAGLRKVLSDASNTFSMVEHAVQSLSATAQTFGLNIKEATDFVYRFQQRGLLTLHETSNSLRLLMESGLGMDTAKQLIYQMTDAASFNTLNQKDMAAAVNQAADAIKNQKIEGLQAIGMNIKIEEVLKNYARTVGKTVETLTQLDRVQALTNVTLEQTARFAGNADRFLTTLKGKYGVLSGEMLNTYTVLGKKLEPLFELFIDRLIQTNMRIREMIITMDDADHARLMSWIQTVTTLFDKLVSGALTVISVIGKLAAINDGALLGSIMKTALGYRVYQSMQLKAIKSTAEMAEEMKKLYIVQKDGGKLKDVIHVDTQEMLHGGEKLKALYSQSYLAINKEAQALRLKSGEMSKMGGAMTYVAARAKTLTASFAAASRAITAFGGATQVAILALKSLGMFMLKLAVIFVAMEIVSWLIGKFLKLKDAARELADANRNMASSFAEVEQRIAQVQNTSSIASSKGSYFGIDTKRLDDKRAELKVHFDKINALNLAYQNSTNEKERENFKKDYDALVEQSGAIIQEVIDREAEVNKILEDYHTRRAALEDKFYATQKDEFSSTGADKMLEAKSQYRDFLEQEEQFQTHLATLRETSLYEAMDLEEKMYATRQRLQEAAIRAQVELVQTWAKKVLDLENQVAQARASNQRDERTRIKAEHDIRMNLLREQEAVQLRELTKSFDNQKSALEADFDNQRTRILNQLASVKGQLDQYNTKEGPSEAAIGAMKSIDELSALVYADMYDEPVWEAAMVRMREYFSGLDGEISLMANSAKQKLDDLAARTRTAMARPGQVGGAIKEIDLNAGVAKYYSGDSATIPASLVQENSRIRKEFEDFSGTIGVILPLLDALDKGLSKVGATYGVMLSDVNQTTSDFKLFTQTISDSYKELQRQEGIQLRRELSILRYNKFLEVQNKLETARNDLYSSNASNTQLTNQADMVRLTAMLSANLNSQGKAYDQVARAMHGAAVAAKGEIDQYNQLNQGLQDNLSLLKDQATATQQELDTASARGKDSYDWVEVNLLKERLANLNLAIGYKQSEIEHNAKLFEQTKAARAIETDRAISAALMTDITEKQALYQARLNHELAIYSETVNNSNTLKEVDNQRQLMLLWQGGIPILGSYLRKIEEINIQDAHTNKLRQDQIEITDRTSTVLQANIFFLEQEITLGIKSGKLKQEEHDLMKAQLDVMTRELQLNDIKLEQLKAMDAAMLKLQETQRNMALSDAFVQAVDPSLQRGFEFLEGFKDIRHGIILEEQKFRAEQARLLRQGAITQEQYARAEVANQEFMSAKQEYERKMHLASLVRDIGKEISLYAARQAAASGNIPAAIAYLAGGFAAMGLANQVARDIESGANARFANAEQSFQDAQDQVNAAGSRGSSRSTNNSRSFGGTIKAENLVVNITPTISIIGEQVFIGQGSVQEFSRDLSTLILETTQQAINNRELDLSNVPRG